MERGSLRAELVRFLLENPAAKCGDFLETKDYSRRNLSRKLREDSNTNFNEVVFEMALNTDWIVDWVVGEIKKGLSEGVVLNFPTCAKRLGIGQTTLGRRLAMRSMTYQRCVMRARDEVYATLPVAMSDSLKAQALCFATKRGLLRWLVLTSRRDTAGELCPKCFNKFMMERG